MWKVFMEIEEWFLRKGYPRREEIRGKEYDKTVARQHEERCQRKRVNAQRYGGAHPVQDDK